MLDSLQIPYAGTYTDSTARASRYPLLLEQNGFRIVLLNYTYGTNGIKVSAPNIVNYIDKDIMARDIETAKALNPDALIACMHWGIEYQSLPNKEQTSLADWLLSRGSHPCDRLPSTRGTAHGVTNRYAQRTAKCGALLFR